MKAARARICWNYQRWYTTHRSMVDSYLREFMWRTKFRELKLFDKILADIAEFSAEFHQ